MLLQRIIYVNVKQELIVIFRHPFKLQPSASFRLSGTVWFGMLFYSLAYSEKHFDYQLDSHWVGKVKVKHLTCCHTNATRNLTQEYVMRLSQAVTIFCPPINELCCVTPEAPPQLCRTIVQWILQVQDYCGVGWLNGPLLQ